MIGGFFSFIESVGTEKIGWKTDRFCWQVCWKRSAEPTTWYPCTLVTRHVPILQCFHPKYSVRFLGIIGRIFLTCQKSNLWEKKLITAWQYIFGTKWAKNKRFYPKAINRTQILPTSIAQMCSPRLFNIFKYIYIVFNVHVYTCV